jgi:hypothetical protein
MRRLRAQQNSMRATQIDTRHDSVAVKSIWSCGTCSKDCRDRFWIIEALAIDLVSYLKSFSHLQGAILELVAG